MWNMSQITKSDLIYSLYHNSTKLYMQVPC